MSALDWTVLLATLALVVAYGVWKGRKQRGMQEYLLAGRASPWWLVAVSIMATQASAITFLSTTGQGYADGMRFVQFYFGLPIAMVVLCATVVPVYHRLKVFTAYEYLESRFDLKTRALAATLFLVQRGLAVGLTIAAPAIVLSVVLGLRLSVTTLMTGGLAVLYTTSGGTKAVSKTHLQQVLIILVGMAAALVVTIRRLPDGVSWIDAVRIAGVAGRMKAVDASFDWQEKYNLWSGVIGGCFLALSYFGTDQSQVQRYLTGSSVAQSRLALLFNGVFKVPMQFGILFVGVMVFAAYHFVEPPLYFNVAATQRIAAGPEAGELHALEREHHAAFEARRVQSTRFLEAERAGDRASVELARADVREAQAKLEGVHARAVALVKRDDPSAKDVNYVFLRFVLDHLPAGLIGLVLAAVFCAAMGSAASELNALAATSVVDVYRRCVRKDATDAHYVRASRAATLLWGAVAVGFAQFATGLGTLVEAVNILGSLFYGTILGIFLVAFYFKRVGGSVVFWSALAAEAAVIALFGAAVAIMTFDRVPYLWLNLIGCALVVLFALASASFNKKARLAPGP